MNKKTLLQFASFLVVGASNTIVSQIVYMICIYIGFHYVAANAAAFVLSVLNAYFWQNKFVFKEDESQKKRVWWKVLLKTYISYAFTGLFLNTVLLALWIDIVKIERFTGPLTQLVSQAGFDIDNRRLAEIISPLINIVINLPLNFIINKFWAYRQKKK